MAASLYKKGIIFVIIVLFVGAGFTPTSVIGDQPPEEGWSMTFEEPGWHYDITFPMEIWLYNSSIKSNDTCENFCQQGGIWDDIECIFYFT